jgi:putative tryptophan/tyrosine transport system substrate-binding protein
MKRREFVTLLGVAAAAWPLAARAQQPAEGMRRIGVLAPLPESDAEGQARIAALRKGLEDLGWREGRNLRIDYRDIRGDAERARAYAAELVALKPDLIVVAASTDALSALQRLTRTIPIVFIQIADPVSAGFVASWARPGGNVTGFGLYESAIGAKWLELLKQLRRESLVRVSSTIRRRPTRLDICLLSRLRHRRSA